ncbi:NAD(P)-binding protein [Aspergillus germanicus]
MVALSQPKVHPLPTGINLTGKTAVVTGASAGLGLEITRQLLQLRISTIILAVRNTAKGKDCAKSLHQDLSIRTNNPRAVIQVIELDMDQYDSVQAFARKLREEVPVVDYLVLNAGIGLIKFERSPSGHERTNQVNYYSNVLLLAELLPHLYAGAEKTGNPVRITWVGSRQHLSSSIPKHSFRDDEGILAYLDTEDAFFPYQRYGDSKLLCVMFMYSLAERIDPNKVVINMMCPGMVNTSMTDVLPLHLRLLFNVVKAIAARSVEVGAWLVLHTVLVAGPESHGKFLNDKTIAQKAPYITSPAGHDVKNKLWKETIAEMSRLTTLPNDFR